MKIRSTVEETYDDISDVEFESVDSSNIDQIGYRDNVDSENFQYGTLYIRFLSGAIYSYTPFTKELYDLFRNAPSKGKHFDRSIKHNPNYKVYKVIPVG